MSRPPSNLAINTRASGPETGNPEMEGSALLEMVNAPLPPPGEGHVENLLFRFALLSASQSMVPKFSTKEHFFSISGSQEGTESCGRINTGPHSSSSVTSRQQQAVRECQQRPYSRTLCQTVEPGKRCTTHTDPSSVLDLCVLNLALHLLPFKMLMQKHIFGCPRPRDWFAAIDLKDAHYHVSILPHHRPFLRFTFEGCAYQYKVLPFGLSLFPRVFMKVTEGALVPLREQDVRILTSSR